MNTVTLNFTVSGQTLTAADSPQKFASNTVNYIQAVFDLDDNWSGFDSVRAVWSTDFACISTVLANGACAVPQEVLTIQSDVRVNLVGSNVENDELIGRMTTYPLTALIIDENASIAETGTA